ncbi:MAG: APC family permease [Caldisphaera sp.]
MGFRKELGFWHVLFLTLGAIIGDAVAFIPVYVLGYDGPAGILSWIVAFLLIIPVALVVIELGTMWPRAGGVAYYPAKSNGPVAGSINGWSAFLGYALVTPSSIIAFVEYLAYYFPSLYKSGFLTVLGIVISAIIALITYLINNKHVGLIGDINNYLTVLKIAMVMIPVLALFAFFNAKNFNSPILGGFMPVNLGAIGFFTAVTSTILAYAGFKQPVNYSEEVKDPGKFIPKAVIASLIITMIIYLVESIAFLGVADKVISNPSEWSSLITLPYPYITALTSVKIPSNLLLILIFLMIAGTIIASYTDALIYFGGASRVGYSLSFYDRYFPKVFSKLNKEGVPYISNILIFVLSIIYLLLLPSFATIFTVLIDAFIFSYAPLAISVAVFRARYPDEKRPFKVPVSKILSPIAFVIGGLLIYWSGWSAIYIAGISVLIGLVFLAYYHKSIGIKKRDFIAGGWLPLYLVSTMIISYFGSSNLNKIPFPYDNILFIVVSLIFYFWGYEAGKKFEY